MKKNIVCILALFIFSFIALFPLLGPGLPPTHDGEYHVIRFYEFDKALRGGDFYPRWAADLNNGYGVPLFNYVYPLPSYFASLFHLFGISFIDAFKLNMFIAGFFGAIFFYLWAKEFWGKLGGIVSSVVYAYSPYHFVDIYIRGSVGEVWALALFPAFLWLITKFIKTRKTVYVPISGFFLGLIIFSHNILALMFFTFTLTYILLLVSKEKRKKKLIINTAYILLLGLSFSAIFWMPAMLEKAYVKGLEIYDVSKNFPEVYQLLFPSWGSGFSEGNIRNQMSFQIGVVNLLVVFISLPMVLIKKLRRERIFFVIWFIFIFFLMLKSSLFIWENVPLMNYFQFPWRFLSLEILISSFIAGSLVLTSKKLRLFISIVIILLAVLFTYGYTKPAYYHDRNDNYYITRSNFIDGTNSIGNYFNTIWFDTNLKKEKNKLFENNLLKLREVIEKPTYYSFRTGSEKDIIQRVNIAYFPGWTVFVDKNKTDVYEKNGLINFNLPSGKHLIEIKFLDTPIRQIAAIISFVAFVLIVFGFKRKTVLN